MVNRGLGHNIDKPLTFGTGYIEISLVACPVVLVQYEPNPSRIGDGTVNRGLGDNIDKPLTFENWVY